ncbi:hypothetical protein [Sulfuriflexus sp.]|uniref:hypothetical protein n=1 Tax=Sulfuriflexus sp. TaxID=2015443 RepID=UPI0028CEE3D8|nr:hypothetical protein [Sulfuriflexus sp.]MDT8405306.1 hypothetical protein [Sulfuriflexus sp.]
MPDIMSNLIAVAAGLIVLVTAIPYVARIRHPQQKPLAAYLIFVSVFIMATMLLFNLLAWLAISLELGNALGKPGPSLVFLALVLLPAIALATWLARKPPWRNPDPPA